MKIDKKLMLKLRKERSWSQEELALAAGLNIRTIQRIEKEATASLQSQKSIASALDVDISDLQYKEAKMFQELLGKNVQIHLNSYIGVKIDSFKGGIVEVSEHWIKIRTKKTTELVNLASVRYITIIE